MQPFRRLDDAVACPLPMANVDTDQILPSRFMKQPRAAGYGGFLLHDLRFEEGGKPRGLALDDPDRTGAKILVARRNFGSGSSREAAVYALVDFGIRCVIAPSFGDIFAANAINNGLLPARLGGDDVEWLLYRLAAGQRTLTVDLEARTVTCRDQTRTFEIDDVWRAKLLNGWDDIDVTASHTDAVANFAARRLAEYPWTQPRA